MSDDNAPATSLAELLAPEPAISPDALAHSEHGDLNADPVVDFVEDAAEEDRPADQGGTGAVVDPAAPAAAAPAGNKAETPPTTATTPAAAAGPETGPKWYREEIKRQQALTQAAEARLAALEARQVPQAQAEEEDDDLPDPFENPKEFAKAVEVRAEAKAAAKFLNEKINNSVAAFVENEGLDTWKEIDLWLGTPAGAGVAAKARASADPAKFCQKEYKKVLATEEIGDDPAAWSAKERERIRAEILAEQEAAAGTEQTPATVTAETKPAAPKPRLPGAVSQTPSAAPRTVAAGPTPLNDLVSFKTT